MTTLQVNLPDDIAAKLRARAGDISAEHYLEALIREFIDSVDVDSPPGIMNEDDSDLENELLRRLDDPRPSVEATPEFWDNIRRRLHERHHSAGRAG